MKIKGSDGVVLSRVKAVRTREPLVYVLEFPGSRARNSSIHGLEERGKPVALVPFKPPENKVMPTTLMRTDVFRTQLLISMLISSRNSLADSPRINLRPVIWVSQLTVKLTYEFNPHCVSTQMQPNKVSLLRIKSLQ